VLSRGLYHGGGEKECNRALALARKALQDDPASPEALVVAGLALVGMERPQAALRYLDQALRIDGERADLRLAMGILARIRGERGHAVRQLETACRCAPDAWETHLELGRALMALARDQDFPRRLVERAQYHLVQALKREPSPDQSAHLLKDLGSTCMHTGRFREAEKFFIRLREHERYAATARYHLGLVAYELGKYNNAILHFRQYLRDRPDDPKVLGWMAMAFFQMGEYPRARQACHQALMADPEDLRARHVLGCTMLEEGEPNEAIRLFRETLKEHPGHMETYVEMARTRRSGGDVRWLIQALAAEVSNFDRLPVGGDLDLRTLTRDRIRVILDELRAVGPSTAGAVLECIGHTQDEGLRFQLWEAACRQAQGAVADEVSALLRDPASHYGPTLGGKALMAYGAVPETVLVQGLVLDDAALRRATVDRHGPAHDVKAHRKNLDYERDQARAYQALLLLSIGTRRSAAGRTLLRKWAEAADPELATAAWAGLAMYGDAEASRMIHERAVLLRRTESVDRLLAQVMPSVASRKPRRISDGEGARCTTCSRDSQGVTHMITGGNSVICDRCVLKVSQNRASMLAPDDAHCSLCSASPFESAGIYRVNSVDICSDCLQLSLGLLEREEVDSFLSAW
jgi:tetratricopeptide (TPR) repeat protein